MDTDTKAVAEIAFDAQARAMSLEALVTRLLASHAQMHPTGVAARMIENADDVARSVVDGLPPEMAGMAPLMMPYLHHYLRRAGDLRDGNA